MSAWPIRPIARVLLFAGTVAVTLAGAGAPNIAGGASAPLERPQENEPRAAGASWRAAEPGRRLEFPADHASHPEYRIEWWYYTGDLAAAGGRQFGYQLTFFRIGVDPAPVNPSRWAVRDLFMAHLAITDLAGRRHLAAERLNRAGVGWAGAASDRYEVWNDSWRARLDGRRHHLQAHVAEQGIGLDLRLDPQRPPVLHGDAGFSRKGSSPGNASHYYSITRLATTGTLQIGGERLAVSGTSWMDHEFGTSFLEPDQTGWDWFALRLDDGTDVMVFQLRGRGGAPDPRSSGTLTSAGGTTDLRSEDFTLTPGRTWRARDGARYPVEWRLQVPRRALDLRVRAALDAQEMGDGFSSGVRYWEGAVLVEGTRAGQPVRGRGYLEMTGYAGRAMGELLGGSRP